MEMQKEASDKGELSGVIADTDLQILLDRAKEKAENMGHTLSEWEIGPNTLVGKSQTAQAICVRCKATLTVRQKVAPEAQIQGDAIIDTCLTYPAKEI